MSDKKDSPIVESTVVKGNATTDTNATNSKDTAKASDSKFDSIADLKQATDIVDSDGKPVDTQAQSADADKKAKIKADIASEKAATEESESNAAPAKPAAKDEAKTKSDSKADTKPATKSKAEAKPKAEAKSAATDKKDSKDDKAADTKASKKSSAKPKKKPSAKLSTNQQRVAVIGGNRIPFARSNGTYADASNTDMLTAALNGLIERFDLQDEVLGEVVAGAVMKLSRDINLTRESVLNTALDPHTPSYDISQACGTG
ncbi:acetyl-CoA C-acetyltransferase, partial [Psychrobacter sp. T6-1]